MAEKIDYETLYALQDRVLILISSLENSFYLTGGTALHRYYYNARFSDDLDFFVTCGESFYEDIDEIFDELLKKKHSIDVVVKAKDFCRVMIDGILQVDFVNDRVYRHKKSNIINNFKVDNKINILTNKINAIIDRDEEKDVFDLFCFAYHEKFNWGDILEIANKKATVEKDVFIYRLKSFPLEWLTRVKSLKEVMITTQEITLICDDILYERDNSLSTNIE